MVDHLYLVFFYKKYLQNLGTTMYQWTCIFHLFLLGIPWSLVLFIKNRVMGGGGLLNGQNLLSMPKAICWWSLKEKIVQTLFEIKNKYIRILKRNLVRLQAPWTVCLFLLFVFFPIQQWLWHNNIVTVRVLNRFDDCVAECVGTRVYLFFLGAQ